MTSTNNNPTILILRPRQQWALVSAELRRVEALGRYMETKGMVRREHLTNDSKKEHLTNDSQKELRQLATLCEELLPESLQILHFSLFTLPLKLPLPFAPPSALTSRLATNGCGRTSRTGQAAASPTRWAWARPYRPSPCC